VGTIGGLKLDKKRKNNIITVFILLIIVSIYFTVQRYLCNTLLYSPEISAVLSMAKDNRIELEKVLKHYSHNPADSLKLWAAEFLILNMPGKYSEYYDAPWEDIASVCYLLTRASNREKLLSDFHLGTPIVQEDLCYITAEYLINNIEMAFQSWQTAPWGKHVSFDIFCEEILPYRIATEPLENWREQVLASFADVYRSLLDSPDMTAIRACRKVNEKLPGFIYGRYFPSMSYRQLMASTRGSQERQATLAIFVMRAMGIPVTLEVMLQPSFNNRCAWNIVCDSAGKHIPFVATKHPPGRWIPCNDWVMAQVLRHTFRRQAHSANIPSDIPYSLDNLIDVTSEYCKMTDIDIAILPEAELADRPPEYACLCIANSSLEWMPACWGQYHNGTYHFASLGVNMLYLPVIYKNGKQTPFNQPFFLTDNNRVIYFEHYKYDSTESFATYPRWRNVRYKPARIETAENLTGWWLFEDTTNYGKATVGKDLEAYKMTNNKSKGELSTVGLKWVTGSKDGKSAVKVPRYSYFKCAHGILNNDTCKNINEYTILMDVKLSGEDEHGFFQTNMDNTEDFDVFLYSDMSRFGVSQFEYQFDPPLRDNEWYRLVISVHLGQSLKFYLNGELIFAGYNTEQDGRLSWSKEGLLLFADDSGNDSDIDVSEVAIFNRALSDEEVFSLGSAGNEWNIRATAPKFGGNNYICGLNKKVISQIWIKKRYLNIFKM
jgi:hypothetical protein